MNTITNEIIDYASKKQAKRVDNSEAMAFLKSPNMMQEIIDDLTECGYVGEDINKQLGYLIATSRKMDDPLAAIIQSRSSAGKSKLMETVMKLIPSEEIINITSASKEAFYYINDLNHKLVCLGESVGMSKQLDYQIRELLSAHEIQKMVTSFNHEGKMESQVKKIKGKIAFLSTTTSPKLNPENLSRCILIYVNESRKQTQSILECQRHSFTIDGLQRKANLDRVVKKHHDAQRLLNKVRVCIRYAEFIDFPAHRINSRRDQMKFLHLLSAITFLHQFQREKQHCVIGGKKISYIESTLDDYKIARELFMNGALLNTLSEIPKMSRDLHRAIVSMLKKKSKQLELPVPNIPFSRKELMNFSQFSFVQVRNYIKVLEEHEIIEIVPRLSRAKRKVYRLVELNLDGARKRLLPSANTIMKRMNLNEHVH